MSKYSYKGTNISTLIVSGTNTVTNYTEFPAYQSASNYSIERPLPFGFNTPTGNINTLFNATYVQLSTVGSRSYNVPADFNSIRAVIMGGGGGGGGGAGCGWNMAGVRYGGSGGESGNDGSITIISSEVSLTSNTISYVVGARGTGGSGGGKKSTANSGSGGDGTPGNAGGFSSITINGVTVYANGGSGGRNGNAGNANSPGTGFSGSTSPAPSQTNTYTPVATSLDSNMNPLSYLSTYSDNGSGGSGSNTDLSVPIADGPSSGGTANGGNSGQQGYIHLYLLKS